MSPIVRRLAWRAGRRLYSAARGEPRFNDITTNGEAYVQASVSAAVSLDRRLQVADIGANQGEWTLSMLKTLPAIRRERGNFKIELFEPVPTTVERLREALAKVGAGRRAEIHQLAVSDSGGMVDIAVMSATGGTNTLHWDVEAGAPTGGFVSVEKLTLSEFCHARGINHIHLAKCDTEGHDLSVLRGAREMLAAGQIDVFQFEYNHRWIYSRTFLKDAFDLISGLPYTIARIMPASIELLPAWHPELERFFEANYLLVRDDALIWFTAHDGTFDVSNTYA